MSTVAEWFFTRNNQQNGPVAYPELVRQARAGSLQPSDLVWKEGMADWMPAGRIGGLFDAPATPRVPPPLAPGAPQAPAAPLGYAGPHSAPPRDIGQDAGIRLLIPVGRSGWAIASGYLGLLALLPFIGLIFGIGAIVTGLLGIRDIRRNPQRHGMGRCIFGLIAGSLGTVAYGIGIVVLLLNA